MRTKEQEKEYNRAYYAANKDSYNKRRKEYYKANREQELEKRREYYERNKADITSYNRQYIRTAKQKFIDGYGGKCTCCGESAFEFLTFEHLNGDGKEHRKSLGGSGGLSLYLDAIRRGFPSEYTVLCFNCNQSKGIYGYCPHQKAGDASE